jgi:transposase
MNKASSAVRDRWQQILEQQKRSGLSIARFCRQRGIPESSLFSWKRRLSRQAQPATAPAFVLVKSTVADAGMCATDSASGAIELHLGRGRLLVLRRGFDPQTLHAALTVLEDRS